VFFISLIIFRSLSLVFFGNLLFGNIVGALIGTYLGIKTHLIKKIFSGASISKGVKAFKEIEDSVNGKK